MSDRVMEARELTRMMYLSRASQVFASAVTFLSPVALLILTGLDTHVLSALVILVIAVAISGLLRHLICLLGEIYPGSPRVKLGELSRTQLALDLEESTVMDLGDVERVHACALEWLLLSQARVRIDRRDGSRVQIRTRLNHPGVLRLLKHADRFVRYPERPMTT